MKFEEIIKVVSDKVFIYSFTNVIYLFSCFISLERNTNVTLNKSA